MKIGIMQPYFFPYIGYFQLINAVDKYVIYDDVNYIKNGWINRNNILLNNQKHLITLPLDAASPFKLINEIDIIQNDKVKEKLLKTIQQAYRKAPYYEEVFPIIKNCIMGEYPLIAEALYHSFLSISQYLGIKTEFILSSKIEKDNELKAQEKVIHICKLLNGTEYFNAIGGQELYSKLDFQNENIKLNFLKTKAIQYNQFNNEFMPNLSIIDVMMFNSPEKVKEMLGAYELL